MKRRPVIADTIHTVHDEEGSRKSLFKGLNSKHDESRRKPRSLCKKGGKSARGKERFLVGSRQYYRRRGFIRLSLGGPCMRVFFRRQEDQPDLLYRSIGKLP